MKLDIDEALRYAGVRGEPPEALRRQAEAVAEELAEAVRPRYTYRIFAIQRRSDGFYLPEADILLSGESAARMLAECDRAALLACTLGAKFDAMLRTEQARDMAQALLLDACGSAWVEAGCNEAERELKARLSGTYLTDRFSPGYGDLPLALQPAVCAVLDTQRRLGLCVTESLLMNPGKSVTAVIGIAERPQAARIRGCACCAMRERCTLRKGGKHCGN
ncbi:MAG: methionine synthase [Oscillospiraceae bacterium]|nr:methionine synthase [Oscillospiraceae bacterium]